MSTNIPFPVFTDTGLSTPPESAIRAGVEADFLAAFGNSLNTSPATPQGQLITSLTAAFGAANDLLLDIINQVDPAVASGRMQDAIARIYYLSRKGALATVVDCTCSGDAQTVIPAGSLALAADGTIYASAGQATIGLSGSVTVSFAAIDPGPIACPAGTLTTIYRIIPGWDSITNPSDGVIGRAVERRAEFEARRNASVAINALGVLPSVRAAILNVDDVIDAYVTENPTASSTAVGGVTLPAKSLYVAVKGGTDADVARAIWKKKPPGCIYFGSTTVVVKDTSSGYSLPYPSYDVKFTRPTDLPIYVAIQLANNGLVPSDAQDQIRVAVAAAFDGSDQSEPVKIGATLYAARFNAGIQALGTWAQIVDIQVGTTSTPTDSFVTVDIDQFPTLDITHVAVTLV